MSVLTEVIKDGRLVVNKTPYLFEQTGLLPIRKFYVLQRDVCYACLVGALVSCVKETLQLTVATSPYASSGSESIGVSPSYYMGLDDGWEGLPYRQSPTPPAHHQDYEDGLRDGHAAAELAELLGLL